MENIDSKCRAESALNFSYLSVRILPIKDNKTHFTDRKIISGGAEGAIRVWKIDLSNLKKPTVSLLETMKEHKCKITAIKVC